MSLAMSLVPYASREGREIVLRHRNAIVVRDPLSQRLEIRAITECPTCGQPLRPTSPEEQFDMSARHDSYVDPDYFRLLGARHGDEAGHDAVGSDAASGSPVRRFVQPALPEAPAEAMGLGPRDEFVSSTPAVPAGSRIRKEAFSPNYFKTFFVEEKELGRGGKGVVLLVRHEIDGCHLGHFACKRVPVGDDHAWLEKVLVEVELLAKLSHPNLVSYRHVWLEDVPLNRFGPSVACAFILQQYCNEGDLQDYVLGDQPREETKEELKARIRRRSKASMDRMEDGRDARRQLKLDKIFPLFKDITSGLAYLHAANYIHRDLKPSNCLLHREGNGLSCLISDFGEVQPENAMRKSTGSTGTISYCAPEVLKTDAAGRYANFTTKSDVFSLGMILYFMCFGRLPYQSANVAHEELEDIELLRAEIADWQGFQEERRDRPDLPNKVYQLLKRLLALNPADRPSAAEVLNAMKSETPIESLPRIPRGSSPPLGLHSRRIQNLDSPMTPGTPLLDARKSARRGPATTTSDMAPAQASPTSPRRRAPAQALSASRSQDGYTRSSPSVHQSESASETSSAGRKGSPPPPDLPLLLPPPPLSPTSTGGGLWQAMRVGWLNISGRNPNAVETLAALLRLGFFLNKMALLVWPCLPYMVRLDIGIPLVILAALELGMAGVSPLDAHSRRRRNTAGDVPIAGNLFGNLLLGGAKSVKISLTLLTLHAAAVWVASRRGMLCVA